MSQQDFVPSATLPRQSASAGFVPFHSQDEPQKRLPDGRAHPQPCLSLSLDQPDVISGNDTSFVGGQEQRQRILLSPVLSSKSTFPMHDHAHLASDDSVSPFDHEEQTILENTFQQNQHAENEISSLSSQPHSEYETRSFSQQYTAQVEIKKPAVQLQRQHNACDGSQSMDDTQDSYQSSRQRQYTDLVKQSHTEVESHSFQQQQKYTEDEMQTFRQQHGSEDRTQSFQAQGGETMLENQSLQRKETDVENESILAVTEEQNRQNENHSLQEQPKECALLQHQAEIGNQTCPEQQTLNVNIRCLQERIDDENVKSSQEEHGYVSLDQSGVVQRSISPVHMHDDYSMEAQPISITQQVYLQSVSHDLKQSRSPFFDRKQSEDTVPSSSHNVSTSDRKEQLNKESEKLPSSVKSDLGQVEEKSENLVNPEREQARDSLHERQDLGDDNAAQQSSLNNDVEQLQEPSSNNGEPKRDAENLAPAVAPGMGHEHSEQACNDVRDGARVKNIDILEMEKREEGTDEGHDFPASMQRDEEMLVKAAASSAEEAMEVLTFQSPAFLSPDQNANAFSSELSYPRPSATHDAVIQDRNLFMSTLRQFLTVLGRRLTCANAEESYRAPKMGGKELDLHALYCEVTSRGGLEQVLRASMWKEVSKALDIPSSLNNSSFVLRKHYSSILFHYEQVYYFRAEGKLSMLPVPLPAPLMVEPTADFGCPYEVPPEMASSLRKRKKKLNPLQFFGVDPAAAVGTVATGAITAKVDEGYLITMVVGSEKLSGILYHVPHENHSQQYASVPSLLDENGNGIEIQFYGKKRKEYVRKKDPNAPKRTRTGYNIFFKEQRARLKQLYPNSKGHGKTVIEMWSKLPESEKALYIARGNEEREKYLQEFREKMRLQSEATDVNTEDARMQEPEPYDVSQDYHVSLDVENELQDTHQVEKGDHGFDVSEPQPPSTEMSSGQLVFERSYQVHEDEEVDYVEESNSEEDGEAELEDVYEEGEDEEIICAQTEALEEVQCEDKSDVHDFDYNTRKAVHAEHVVDDMAVHELPTTVPHQSSFGQDHHTVSCVPTLLHQQSSLKPAEGSGEAPIQAAIDKNTMLQRHHDAILIPPHFAAENNGMTHKHSDGVALHSHARQTYAGDTLRLSLLQEQNEISAQKPEEGPVYLQSLHQNQASLLGIHTQKLPLEQDGFPCPLQFSYPPMYPHSTHDYQPRFPHFPYPIQMTTQSQNPFGAYAAQMHQQVPAMDVQGGVSSGSSSLYDAQDTNPLPLFNNNNLHKK